MLADPKLVDWKNNNFHLQEDSPAIDAAQHLGYKQDFDKKPVPTGKKPDIGAFEFASLKRRAEM